MSTCDVTTTADVWFILALLGGFSLFFGVLFLGLWLAGRD